jgi:hypothetical protein
VISLRERTARPLADGATIPLADGATRSLAHGTAPSLRDVQQAFASAVRCGDPAAIARLIDANGIDPCRRVRIYANNVRENFLATLEATYPVLLQLAGRDWLRQAGASYLRVHPSRSGNLHYVGERFAAYLELQVGDSEYAYFVDVARLEWAYQEALVAAHGTGLDLAALSEVPAERHEHLVFELHPAVRLVASRFPLLAIWKANRPTEIGQAQTASQADAAAGSDTGSDLAIDLGAGASRVVIVRRDTQVELRELPAGQFAFLEAAARREPLLAAVAAAMTADDSFSLPNALLDCARLGLFASFHLSCPLTDSAWPTPGPRLARSSP